MKYINNQKGIALVMVLVLSMIALAIVSTILFMLTKETVLTGSEKFYRTAEEAGTGGAELVSQYLSNLGILNIPASQNRIFTQDITKSYGSNCYCNPDDPTKNFDNMTGARSDRCDKICLPTDQWPAALDEGMAAGVQVSLDPTAKRLNGQDSADLKFTLGVAPQTFDVYAKIVDTVPGNTNTSNLNIEGDLQSLSVTTAKADMTPHYPFLYRVEIRAQSTLNPRERSRISLLYAY